MTDYLSIDVGGRRLERWLSYQLDADMLQPADTFQLQMAAPGTFQERAELRLLLEAGSPVKAHVLLGTETGRQRRVLQHTGVVDSRTIRGDRQGGTLIDLRCRDLAAHLVDSSVPLDRAKAAGTNFVDLVRELTEPWGIDVELDAAAARHIATGQIQTTREGRLATARARRLGVPRRQMTRRLVERAADRRVPLDEVLGASSPAVERAARRARKGAANALTASDVERLKIDEARPQAGETVWEYLARHARRFGLMIWFSPEGKLVISCPDYASEPLFRIVRRIEDDAAEPNNVLSGTETTSSDRYSEVTVYGRTQAKDTTRSRHQFTATDPDAPHYRPLVAYKPEIRSTDEAKREATRALYATSLKQRVLEYSLVGHGDGEHVYAIDALYDVLDEVLGVRGRFYCHARSLRGDRDSGATTTVRLVPVGAIQL